MPQRRDNAGAVCDSDMGMLFLARATVGTSLYVSLSQLVSQLVSQLDPFCFSKRI